MRPQVCSVLVWSVSRSLHHNVIAGSTHELYTCLFRQMARLLLKMSRCLAYAAQPAMILRCISLSWFFSSRLSLVPSTSNLGHFLSAHCSRLLGCCLQPSPLSLQCLFYDPFAYFHRIFLVASVVVLVAFL